MTFFRIKRLKNKKKEDRCYAVIVKNIRPDKAKKQVKQLIIKNLGRVYEPFSIQQLIDRFPGHEKKIRNCFEKRTGEKPLSAAEKGLATEKAEIGEIQKGYDWLFSKL